jgi:hypothetical protein
MIDVTDVVGLLPEQGKEQATASFGGAESELPSVRLFAAEDDAEPSEFFWPFDQMPETD